MIIGASSPDAPRETLKSVNILCRLTRCKYLHYQTLCEYERNITNGKNDTQGHAQENLSNRQVRQRERAPHGNARIPRQDRERDHG